MPLNFTTVNKFKKLLTNGQELAIIIKQSDVAQLAERVAVNH